MVGSATIALLDLCVWGKKKHEEELTIVCEAQTRTICRRCEEAIDAITIHAHRTADENEPPEHKTVWPVKWLMVVEFFLILALIWMWFTELAVTMNRHYYYDYDPVSFTAYAGMPALIAIVLHAKCWLTAFRAREKQRWRREHDLEGGCDAAVAATARPVPGGRQDRTAVMPASTASNTATYIGDTVQKLDREPREVLSSKSWIAPATAAAARNRSEQERQSLLPKVYTSNAKPISACTHTLEYGTTEGSRSGCEARHGRVAMIEDDSEGSSSDGIEPIKVNRQAAYLTPSITSPTPSPESIDAHSTYGRSTTTLGQSSRAESSAGTVRNVDVLDTPDYSDDAEIMVIKKTRKSKQGKRVKQHAEEEVHR